MEAKPDGWDQSLKDMIASGKNFKTCNTELKSIYGAEEGKLGSSTFSRYKKDLTGGAEVDNDLKALKDIKSEEKPPKKKLPPWSKQKQAAADSSKLATVLNTAMYHGLLPVCKNKQLKEKDVQEVNFGGAVVGTVGYLFPQLNMEHPLILLATRGIILYLKFKVICGKIEDMKAKVSETIGGIKAGGAGGIAEGWEEAKL